MSTEDLVKLADQFEKQASQARYEDLKLKATQIKRVLDQIVAKYPKLVKNYGWIEKVVSPIADLNYAAISDVFDDVLSDLQNFKNSADKENAFSMFY